MKENENFHTAIRTVFEDSIVVSKVTTRFTAISSCDNSF